MENVRDLKVDLRMLQRYVPFLTYLMRKHEENPAKTRLLTRLQTVKRLIGNDPEKLDKETIVRLRQVLQQLFDQERRNPLEYVKPNVRQEPLSLRQLELLLEEILGNHAARVDQPRGGALAPNDDDDDIIEIPQAPRPAIPVITIEDDVSPRSPSPVPLQEIPSHAVPPPTNVYPPPLGGVPPENNHFQCNNIPNYHSNGLEVRVIPSERLRDTNPAPNHWPHPPTGHHAFSLIQPKPEPHDYSPTNNRPQFPYPNSTQQQYFPPHQSNACVWPNSVPPPNHGWERLHNGYPPVGNFCQSRPPVYNFPTQQPNPPFSDHRARFPRPWYGRPNHAPPPTFGSPTNRLQNRPFRVDRPWEHQREERAVVRRRERGWNEMGMKRRTVAPFASSSGTNLSNSANLASKPYASSTSLTAAAASQSSNAPSSTTGSVQAAGSHSLDAENHLNDAAVPVNLENSAQEIEEVEPMQETDTKVEFIEETDAQIEPLEDIDTQMEPQEAILGLQAQKEPKTPNRSESFSTTPAAIQATSLWSWKNDSRKLNETQCLEIPEEEPVQETRTEPSGSENFSVATQGSQASSETEKSDPSMKIVESYIKRAFSGPEAEAILAKIRSVEAPKEQAPLVARRVVKLVVKKPENKKSQKVQEESLKVGRPRKIQEAPKASEGRYVQRRLIPQGVMNDAMCRLRNSFLEEEDEEKDTEDEYENMTEEDNDTENEKEKEDRPALDTPNVRKPEKVILNKENERELIKREVSGLKKRKFKKTRRLQAKLASYKHFGSTSWLMRRKRAKDIVANPRKRVPVSTKMDSDENSAVTNSILEPDTAESKTEQILVIGNIGANPGLDMVTKIDQSAAKEEEKFIKEELESTLESSMSASLPLTSALKEAAVGDPAEKSPGTPELIILYDSDEERDENLLLKTEESDEPDVLVIELDDDSLHYVGSVQGIGWETEYDPGADIEEFILSSDSSVPGSPCNFDKSVPTLRQPN